MPKLLAASKEVPFRIVISKFEEHRCAQKHEQDDEDTLAIKKLCGIGKLGRGCFRSRTDIAIEEGIPSPLLLLDLH